MIFGRLFLGSPLNHAAVQRFIPQKSYCGYWDLLFRAPSLTGLSFYACYTVGPQETWQFQALPQGGGPDHHLLFDTISEAEHLGQFLDTKVHCASI